MLKFVEHTRNNGSHKTDVVDINDNNENDNTNNVASYVEEDHHTQTCHWLPPAECWDKSNGLPYGWEKAVDSSGKTYFINHMTKTTSTELPPRNELESLEPPVPREVELYRDPHLGFGFVAGSEKPVIVRFVTEGGPSVDQLLPGDEIIKINEEDVKKAPREYVIDLVRSCKETIKLTVCQPHSGDTNHKSALLTAAKKARLKNHPSRVRFAESVEVNGDTVMSVPSSESCIPFMPNVLKVFLENGQTKSFKYNNKTVVRDVIFSLQEKLDFTSIEHFALVLQNTQNSNCHSKMTILQEHELLSEIASRPEANHYKCLFRLAFVPRDAYDLLRKDAIAFEYFYLQCCNDVVQERFSAELKYDTALRLAALQIQQHAITSNTNKLSLKAIEKECGLSKFVTKSILDSMKGKDLRKMISHYIKVNQNLAPGQRQLTELQAKLHYMKIVGDIRSFGGKYFMVTLVDPSTEAMILVGYRNGISLVPVSQIKNNALTAICDFSDIDNVVINQETESMQRIQINVLEHVMQPSSSIFLMLKPDVHDFVSLVEGYCRVFLDIADHNIVIMENGEETKTDDAFVEKVPYHAKHTVVPSSWSYTTEQTETADTGDGERVVDLTSGPPSYVEGDTTSDNNDQLKGQDLHLGIGKEQISILTNAILSGVGPAVSSVEITKSNETITETAVQEEFEQTINQEVATTNVDAQNIGADDEDSISSTSTLLNSKNNSESNDKFTDSENTEVDIVIEQSRLSRKVSKVDELEGLRRDSKSMDDMKHVADNDDQDSIPDSIESESAISDNSADNETKPLLSAPAENYHDNSMKEIICSAQALSESDDTDSYSTPTDSPAKLRLDHVNLVPPALHCKTDPERPTCLPKQPAAVIPVSEQEYKNIASSFGLRSPDQLELLDFNFREKLLSVGGIELDPDIIDLTMIPPPKTPDVEQMLDFNGISEPPAGFTDDVVEPEQVKSLKPDTATNELEEFSYQRTSKQDREERESETDSGNETISSENVELLASSMSENMAGHVELSLPRPVYECSTRETRGLNQIGLDTDIETLIAKLTVPPPPRDLSPVAQQTPIIPGIFTTRCENPPSENIEDFDNSTLGRKIKGKRLVDKERRLTGPVVASNVAMAMNEIGPRSPLLPIVDNCAKTANQIQTEKVFAFDENTVFDEVDSSRNSNSALNSSSTITTSRSDSILKDPSESSTTQQPQISLKYSVDDSSLSLPDETISSIRSKVIRTRSVDRGRSNNPVPSDMRTHSDENMSKMNRRSGTLEDLRRRSAAIQQKYLAERESRSRARVHHSSLEQTWPLKGNDLLSDHERMLSSGNIDCSKSSSNVDRSDVAKLTFNLNGSEPKLSPRDPRVEMLSRHQRSASADIPQQNKAVPFIRQALHPTGRLTQDLSPRTFHGSYGKFASNDAGDSYKNLASAIQPLRSSPLSVDAFDKPRSSSLDLGKNDYSPTAPITTPRTCRDSPRIQNWVKFTMSSTVRKLMNDEFSGPNAMVSLNDGIEQLLNELNEKIESFSPAESIRRLTEFKFYKDSLVYEARQFVTDSKLLVSSTTQSNEKLTEHINNSVHTLAKVVNYMYITISVMLSNEKAVMLASCIYTVCEAYRTTVNAADQAVGKPMSDPSMKFLMKQATALANVLSQLMKTLKTLSDIDEPVESKS
ncbi:uncharacterized protein LOC141905072 [Tubulanus polymorphus]|uniref:uncharacterized protein LOC141905072 n=1 Tax=Tubulanus polymorphus TaxID=672921 RepID=UPI003DA251DA